MEQQVFDLSQSIKARDEALLQVSDNAGSFMKLAMVKLAQLPLAEYSGEDIRRLLSGSGIVPHTPHAWGALISHAIKKGYLIDTGRITKMKSKTSHARKTSIYLKR